MTLYLSLIFHFIGDYLFQNDWMAKEKVEKSWVALLHATIYSIPFMFLLDFNILVAFILITHFFIDRFRLAVYWIKLANWNWKSENFGYPKDTPKWLSMWLMIIIDNVFHLIINTIIIIIIKGA